MEKMTWENRLKNGPTANFQSAICAAKRPEWNHRREIACMISRRAAAEDMRHERNSMRDKLMRLMQGRYGVDQLSRFLMGAAFICMLLSLFIRGRGWSVLVLFLILCCYFRMFSRNIQARYAENMKYLHMTAGLRRRMATMRRDMADRKTSHIYRCPGCRQKIRVPRGRGKIAIRCPKCEVEFIRRS